MKAHVFEGLVAGSLTLFGMVTLGTGWMSTTACLPVGWLVLGPIILLFVPALAIVTAISRKLGVRIEVEDTKHD